MRLISCGLYSAEALFSSLSIIQQVAQCVVHRLLLSLAYLCLKIHFKIVVWIYDTFDSNLESSIDGELFIAFEYNFSLILSYLCFCHADFTKCVRLLSTAECINGLKEI